MKTQTQNNTMKLAGTMIALVMILAASVMPAKATNSNGSKDSKVKKEDVVTKVDSVHIEEMLFELSEADKEPVTFATSPTIEVYDAKDQLIFSGTQTSWDNSQNKTTTMLKRKAELLFELDNARVYKVF